MAASTHPVTVRILAIVGLIAVGAGVAVAVSSLHRGSILPTDSRASQPVANATPAQPTPPAAAAVAPSAPAFDVVRINPDGGAVIAGRAAPGADVSVQENGKSVGETKADSHGTWVLTPDKLQPGAGELTVTSHDAAGSKAAEAPVVVMVPNQTAPSPPALALLTPPNAPSKLLQGPTTPAPAGKLGLDTVDYDQHGKIEFSGSAPADAPVRAYVDNHPLGDTKAGEDGRWSLSPPAEVPPGLHTLRLDQLTASGQVSSRVEVPFQRDVLATPQLADGTVVVQPGNNLWRIARYAYGQGVRYTVIFLANHDQIRSARLIYPGQVFTVPDLPVTPAAH